MSDYLFMLESHLTPSQREVIAAVEAAGSASGEQTFLVGGALRDMLGGFLITDLDFAVQGDSLAIADRLAGSAGAEILESDSHFMSAELRFSSRVTAEIAMTRTEEYTKPGALPKVKRSGIHEYLLRRDFTMNSIALSLHPASKGLLLDPCNGAADIEQREVRTNSNYGFYDDPSRLLRLIRLKTRLEFGVEEKTRRQYENALQAGVEQQIPPRALFRELKAIAGELKLAEVVAELDKEGLLRLFSPALKGAKANLATLGKLEKALQMIPYGVHLQLDPLGLFLYFLTEKLTPKEKADLIKNVGMKKQEVEAWQKLESRSKKLERDLKSAKLHRTSELYQRLLAAPGDEIFFLYIHSKERLVHDRIRSFLQKHLFTALEVTDREVAAMSGVEPADPKFAKYKEEVILARLDGRKWKPPAREKPAEPPPENAGRKRRAARKNAAKKAPKESAGKTAKKTAAGKSSAAPRKARKSAAKGQ